MTDKPVLILNVNEGQDVIHRYPSFEECNQDDAKGQQRIDVRTAGALIATGEARTCEHCIGPEAHL